MKNTNNQYKFILGSDKPYLLKDLLLNIRKLCSMHREGKLGGENMPEDSNPQLDKNSSICFHYFTLPMAINYQRNSYSLWKACLQTYNDDETRLVFNPSQVIKFSKDQLKKYLMKYGVAIQPVKHTDIWMKISETICNLYDGDVRQLFKLNNWHIPNILNTIQFKEKARFPYLSGPKISNYWLYVIDQYTNAKMSGREMLSIAADTHVIQASVKLGLLDPDLLSKTNLSREVNNIWNHALSDSGISPIDIHTPLWLWSKSGFIDIE